MDYSPQTGSSVHGILQARIWSGLPFPSPGDLPDPGIKSAFLSLQADSLLLRHGGSKACTTLHVQRLHTQESEGGVSNCLWPLRYLRTLMRNSRVSVIQCGSLEKASLYLWGPLCNRAKFDLEILF